MSPVIQYISGWSAAATICLIAGLLLLIMEMFTPGMGMPGLLGVLLLAAAVVLRADSLATAMVTLVLILVPVGAAAALILRSFSRGALQRSPIVLKDAIRADSSSLSDAETQALVGREGVCLNTLRPSGNADFDGLRLDVVSEGEFIAKDSRVRVVRVEGLKILVKKVDEA